MRATVKSPTARPDDEEPQEGTMIRFPSNNRGRAGVFAVIVGIVLAIAATWALVVAPEEATIHIQNRTGRRQYELGLWALYIAPFLAFFLGWYGLRPIAEAGTRRPGLIIVMMSAVAVAWQWSMISEVLAN